jgi:hypothetical protein
MYNRSDRDKKYNFLNDNLVPKMLCFVNYIGYGLMIYILSLLSITAIVTFLKTNDCPSLSLPNCRSGRDICVLGKTMHLFISLMVNHVTLLYTTALVII